MAHMCWPKSKGDEIVGVLHVRDPQLASVSAWKDGDLSPSWVLWKDSHAQGEKGGASRKHACGLDMG